MYIGDVMKVLAWQEKQEKARNRRASGRTNTFSRLRRIRG